MNPLQNFISRLTGSKTLQQAQAVAADPELAAQSVKLAAVFESAGLSLADALADENLIAKAIANAREQGEAAAVLAGNAPLAEARIKLDSAETKIAELSAKVSSLEASEKAYSKSLAAYSAIGAKLGVMPDAPAEDIAKAFENHASMKAADILGSQGISAAVGDTGEPAVPLAKSRIQLVAEFNKLSDPQERAAFYAKHLC